MQFVRIFLVLFFSLALGFKAFAADDANLYFVENVVANVAGKSPVDARNSAVKSARRDAFAILLSRLSVDAKIVSKINDEDISDMVRAEQVFDEKISGNSYSAALNITFAKDFVDHILSGKGSQSADVSKLAPAEEVKNIALIIPAKVLQKKILLWEGSNDWRSSISNALDGKENFKIPVADIDNITILLVGLRCS